MRKISRLLGVLLAASLTAGVLAGCGGSGTADNTTASGMEASETAAEGTNTSASDSKSIVFGMNGTWNSMMPFDATTTNSWTIQDLLYEPLGKYSQDIVWRCATSIDVEEEGLLWTVHLNDQMKWHDGEPCTADDWVWTMETVTAPEFGIYKGLSTFNQIAGTDEAGKQAAGEEFGVKKVDDYTFTIAWKAPKDLYSWMCADTLYYRAVPKHLLEDIPVNQIGSDEFWQHPIGNGPCIFEAEPVPGQELKLKANKDYCLGTPQYDEVTYLVVDLSNAANAYLNGEIDIYNGNLTKEVRDQLEGQNGIHVEVDSATRRINMMYINNSKETLINSSISS